MDANNEIVYKQHSRGEQTEAQIESSAQEKESVEQVKETQETESVAQNEIDGKAKSKSKPEKPKRPLGRPKKINRILTNWIHLNNRVKRDPPQYKIHAPEQWESRLRQSGRESVRNKIKTVSKELLAVENERKAEKRREKQQNGCPEFTFVKVEGNAGILDADLFVKVEPADQSTKESAEQFYNQNSFSEFSVVKVADNQHSSRSRKGECHTSPLTEKRISQIQRRRERPNRYQKERRLNETLDEKRARLKRDKMRREKQYELETEEEKRKRLDNSRRRLRGRYRNRKEGRIKNVGDKTDNKNIGSKIENMLHEAVSATQASVITRDTTITKETKTDVVVSLLDFISRTQHLHHFQQRLPAFVNLSTSRSSHYILSAVAWHKLNRLAD